MQTVHSIIIENSQKMKQIDDNSVHLVVTSPPYPMIQMWDDMMIKLNPDLKLYFDSMQGMKIFELMHCELDKVWKELDRVVCPGGIVCINVGDATRSINNRFALYSNHSRIIEAFNKLNFSLLPSIIWRKKVIVLIVLWDLVCYQQEHI